MILALGAWIISAELLLERTGPVALKDLLLEVPAVYLIALAGLISGIFFLERFEKKYRGNPCLDFHLVSVSKLSNVSGYAL